MEDAERARRAQYREQAHYAARYSGWGGYARARQDEVADRLHSLPEEIQLSIWALVVALVALAFALGGGLTWWLLLSVPVFLISAFIALASTVFFVRDL